MAKVALRPADMTDVAAIRKCVTDAYAQARRDLPDLPDVTEGIEEDILKREVCVAETDEELWGVIVFGQDESAMKIFNLAVSPSAQGQGVARMLLAAAEKSAMSAGLTHLSLRTHRLMRGTRDMYQHLEWVDVEETGNTVVMEKQLKPSGICKN